MIGGSGQSDKHILRRTMCAGEAHVVVMNRGTGGSTQRCSRWWYGIIHAFRGGDALSRLVASGDGEARVDA